MSKQLLQIKDTEQRLALKAWKEKGFKGSVIAGTGFGKSRVGVMAIGEILRRREGRGLLLLYRDWETDRKSTRLNSSHRL